MAQMEKTMDIRILPYDVMVKGSFDGGKITEFKPVPFPHEDRFHLNTGPLFYWAWATARGHGKIGLHPHRGFEIMGYALNGEIGHYDTMGNRSLVKAGGAQVMQAGSGISHEEETIGGFTDFFQIWFDPGLQKSLHKSPVYREFPPEAFPVQSLDGVEIKSIIGGKGPVSVDAEVVMKDIEISPEQKLVWSLEADYSLSVVVINGEGWIINDADVSNEKIQPKDYIHVRSSNNEQVGFQAGEGSRLRIALIQTPLKVDYPLYPER